MNKMFFFDIDGTLIDLGRGVPSITSTTMKSLDQLKKQGDDVFLATGRCHCFIVDGVAHYPFSGYVTCNGAHVTYKNEIIYKSPLSKESILKTIELSKKYGFRYYFESNDYIYIDNKNDPVHQKFAHNWEMKDKVLVDEFNVDDIEVYIGMISINDVSEDAIVREHLSEYFDIQRHQNIYSYDLNKKGISKATGIKELVKGMQRDMKNTVAFGDANNDVEMLETVNLGIAMGHSLESAIQASDYVTDSVENEGITKALKHFSFIE